MNVDICEILNSNGSVRCFLTNENGEQVDPSTPGAVVCSEVVPEGGREDVTVTLSNGEEVTLQKVQVRKEGYIAIEISGLDAVCTSNPIKFSFIETLLLCAPQGTQIVCDVTSFSCFVSVNCQNGELEFLDIAIYMCQDVQSVYDTVLQIPGRLCEPRQEINPITICSQSVLPQQCPIIFPTRGTVVPKTDESGLKSTASEALSLEETVPDDLVPVPNCDSKPPIPEEFFCVSVPKVYDWIAPQESFNLRKYANDIIFTCILPPCDLHLFTHAIYICEGTIYGKVICGEIPVEGVEVTLSGDPNVLTFDPNPVLTDELGNFEALVEVADGTLTTEVLVTGTATVNDQVLSTSLEIIAECHEPCIIDLFAPTTITCDGFLDGKVRCGDEAIEGAVITITANPNVITFDPNPTVTDTQGNYYAGINVPPGTPQQVVTITVNTTVEGQPISSSVDVTVECPAEACEITLNVPALITCTGTITGNISCDGVPEEGAEILITAFPDVLIFTPNPVTSDVNGDFTVIVTVPPGMEDLAVLISATATVGGDVVSTHVGTHVDCPPIEECPCKIRLGIMDNSATATAIVTQQGVPSTQIGAINVTAVECFTSGPQCNPAVDNFNITFKNDGMTINFLMGRRMTIECDGNTAIINGTAMASGNVLNGIFEVFIEVSIDNNDIGTWTIVAYDLMGNAFTTTFTAMMSPLTFIGECNERP